MSWRAICSSTAPYGAKFLFHPSEAHSAGMTAWLRNNYHDLLSLNPGWIFKPREVLTNNPHISMSFANGHTRSIALFNATEEEVEEAFKALVEYGKETPRDVRASMEYEPQVVSYSPATFGYGVPVVTKAVGRRDIDYRLSGCSPQEKETFGRPGQVRPQRYGMLNRGRGDATYTVFHPGQLAGSWNVNTM